MLQLRLLCNAVYAESLFSSVIDYAEGRYAECYCTECHSTDDFKTCVAPYLTLLSSLLFELMERLLFLLREATEINWLHASSLTEGERVIKNYLSAP
jgi:hypothetical protein